MRCKFSVLLAITLSITVSACGQGANDLHLVNQAVSAAPDGLGDGATVYAYTEAGTYRTVREGDNGLVCVADNPHVEGFEAVCFHDSLEPYMRRGRDLNAEGITGQDNVRQRGEEVENGSLSWPGPDTQATLYIRYGENARYDEASGEVVDSQIRYVIYTPYATSATTGLSETPLPGGGPWLMSGGTFRAHIMIVPPRGNH